MGALMTARDRFVQTRQAVIELNNIKALIMSDGDDWKPPGVKVHAVSDPTASRAIRNVDEWGEQLAELRKRLKLDCAVMLGDYTVGGASDTVAKIKEDLTGVKGYMANGVMGIPNIWCTGNHDPGNREAFRGGG